jgi:hypothetical protein
MRIRMRDRRTSDWDLGVVTGPRIDPGPTPAAPRVRADCEEQATPQPAKEQVFLSRRRGSLDRSLAQWALEREVLPRRCADSTWRRRTAYCN